MTNLQPDFCLKLREARRAAGVSQSQLSTELGCKQSALSMFEAGDGTKLNDEVVEKLSQRFNIPIQTLGSMSQLVKGWPRQSSGSGFCPNPECPSNHSYDVGTRRLLKPNRTEADPVGGHFCALCGEVLERKCPNCGASVHDGAICSMCGTEYIVI